MPLINKSYVETSHGLIHYRAAGEVGRPPLLLLHQTASSSAMYEPLMHRLADRFHILAPDTPGFGESARPAGPATMSLYGAALRECAQKFGLAVPSFVFGHHTGASIAVQIESDTPGFCRKLALSGPPYLTPGQKRALREGVVPISIQPDGSHLQTLWQRLRAKDLSAPLALTHREFLLNLSAGERYHEAYEAVADHDFEGQLARITCPVLLMAGAQDTLFGSLEPASRALPSAEVARLPRGNTYVCDLETDLVAEHLVRFFGM
jgi:pimeloyl-ACP methyl ester carboxylesterase